MWSWQNVLNFLPSKPFFISLSRFTFRPKIPTSAGWWAVLHNFMFIVCTVDFYVVMTQYSRTSDWFAKNCILPDVSSMLTMSGLIFAKWKSASFGSISMIPWAIRMDAVVFMLFFLENREHRCIPWPSYRCWFENCKPVLGLMLSQHGMIFILSMLWHVS